MQNAVGSKVYVSCSLPSGLVGLSVTAGFAPAAGLQRLINLRFALGYGLNEDPAEEEYRPPPDLVSVE